MMGKARTSTPTIMQVIPTALPNHVCGTWSPYPTVASVTRAHQNESGIDWKSDGTGLPVRVSFQLYSQRWSTALNDASDCSAMKINEANSTSAIPSRNPSSDSASELCRIAWITSWRPVEYFPSLKTRNTRASLMTLKNTNEFIENPAPPNLVTNSSR
eukprot:gene10256-biopygen10262